MCSKESRLHIFGCLQCREFYKQSGVLSLAFDIGMSWAVGLSAPPLRPTPFSSVTPIKLKTVEQYSFVLALTVDFKLSEICSVAQVVFMSDEPEQVFGRSTLSLSLSLLRRFLLYANGNKVSHIVVSSVSSEVFVICSFSESVYSEPMPPPICKWWNVMFYKCHRNAHDT